MQGPRWLSLTQALNPWAVTSLLHVPWAPTPTANTDQGPAWVGAVLSVLT